MFKIEPFRNQEINVNIDSEETIKPAKKKQKVDQEDDDKEKEKKEQEKLLKIQKQEETNQILRLGHEKLIVSCLGIGFTNLTKTFI